MFPNGPLTILDDGEYSTSTEVEIMGESRKRKNKDGKYVSFKGDSYKNSQWRLMVRYLRFLHNRRNVMKLNKNIGS